MSESTSWVRLFFDGVLVTSWQASVVVGLILLISWLLRKRLSPRARHGLWLVVLAKLALPLLPVSSLSVFNWVPPTVGWQSLQSSSSSPVVLGDEPTVDPVAVAASPLVSATESSFQTPTGSERPSIQPSRAEEVQAMTITEGLAWIWLLGCSAFCLQMLYQNVRFSRSIRNGRPVQDGNRQGLFEEQVAAIGLGKAPRLVESSAVTSPAVYGLCRPRLILPPGMINDLTEEQLRHVFLHELAHLRRRDLWLLWLAHVLRAIHWFNPLIWFAVHQMRRECELATDALALKCAGEEAREAYGDTIIHLLRQVRGGPRLPGLVGIVEGKKEIARRILSIRDFRRKPKRSLVAIGITVLLVGASLTQAIPNVSKQSAESYLSEIENEVDQADVRFWCRVVDPSGAPVPGASVEFGMKNWWFAPHGETDENGAFKVVGDNYKPDLIIRAKGFAPTLFAFDYDRSNTNRVYQLEEAASVRGVVVDPLGLPIADAEVIPTSWYRYSSFDRGLKTGSDGAFVWPEAPNHGSVFLTVFAKGYKAVRDFEVAFDHSPTIQMSKPDRVIGTVVDARTGRPVPSFRFEIGERGLPKGRVMNTLAQGSGTNGAFEVDVKEPAQHSHVVTVFADGYAPAQSRDFLDGEGILRFRFEMQNELPLRVRVRQPDGRPAVGATIVQKIKRDHQIWMTEPRTINLNRIRDKSRIAQTDDSGACMLKPVIDVNGIVVTHETGFAEVDFDSVRAGAAIRLQDWARVEGTLFSGGRLVEGGEINLWRIDMMQTIVLVKGVSDADGRFVFDGIPGGQYRLEKERGTRHGWVDVAAGETANLVVGYGGQTLVGRALLAGMEIEDLNWQRESQYLSMDLRPPGAARPPTREERAADPDSLRKYHERQRAYLNSPDGKLMQQRELRYAVQFSQDGSFRIEDVVPGEYVLDLQIKRSTLVDERTIMESVLAAAPRLFVTVPGGGEGARPVIELGTLELKPQ